MIHDFESTLASKTRLSKEERKARERVDSLDSHSSNSDLDDYETTIRKLKQKNRAQKKLLEQQSA